VPGLTVGPWIKVVVSVGITNGSSIGLITCRGATLNGRVAFGGGFSVNVGAPEMTAILAKFGIKLPAYDNELASVEFVNKSATVPDVPLCTGPADA
jgi:hypothetical protein